MLRLTIVFIAFSIAFSSGSAIAQTATNLVCTRCVSNSDLGNNSINSANIANGTVTNADLAPNAVTGGRIQNGSIGVIDLDAQLQGGLIASITRLSEFSSDEGVAAVSCPSDRMPVAASCGCFNEEGARNFGVLFACTVDGDGAIAGCFPESGTFDPQLPAPLAIVAAECLGATSIDGTPWLPAPTGLLADASSMTAEDAAAQAKWIKERHSSLKTTLFEKRRVQQAQLNRLLVRQ